MEREADNEVKEMSKRQTSKSSDYLRKPPAKVQTGEEVDILVQRTTTT